MALTPEQVKGRIKITFETAIQSLKLLIEIAIG